MNLPDTTCSTAHARRPTGRSHANPSGDEPGDLLRALLSGERGAPADAMHDLWVRADISVGIEVVFPPPAQQESRGPDGIHYLKLYSSNPSDHARSRS